MSGYNKRLRVALSDNGPWYEASAYDTDLNLSKSTVDEIIDIGDGIGERNVYPTYMTWSFSATLRDVDNQAMDILEDSMFENIQIWIEYVTETKTRRARGIVDRFNSYGDVSTIEEIDIQIRGAGKLERV